MPRKFTVKYALPRENSHCDILIQAKYKPNKHSNAQPADVLQYLKIAKIQNIKSWSILIVSLCDYMEQSFNF